MPSLQRQMTAKRAWSELTRQRNEAFNVGYTTAIKLAYERMMLSEEEVSELLGQLEPHELAWAASRVPQPLDKQGICMTQNQNSPQNPRLSQ